MKKAILARAFRGELGTNDPKEESESNTIYNVGMQLTKHKSLPKRLRYYQGNIVLKFPINI